MPLGKLAVTLHLELLLSISVSKTIQFHGLRTKISKVRKKIEQELGIPSEMYYLTFLDADPLDEKSTLGDHFVVDGSTLTLRPWKIWHELLEHAFLGKVDSVMKTMSITGSSKWNKHCAWCALYIAAHHGYENMVARILKDTYVPINAQCPSSGWTALHAATRMGRWKALCILLDKGADVRIEDADGRTAVSLSRIYSQKKCENSLRFCQWNLQKHFTVKERSVECDPLRDRRTAERQSHLHFDSTLQTWRRGTQGQIYMLKLPNPVSVHRVKEIERDRPTLTRPCSRLSPVTDGERFDFNYGWFDPLRAQQLIPPTDDILTYADPSSCSLRPHSILNPGGYKKPRVRIIKTPTVTKQEQTTNKR